MRPAERKFIVVLDEPPVDKSGKSEKVGGLSTTGGKIEIPFREMNRSPFTPTAGATARFPSGWRARLARDPIPTLLRGGPPSLTARVRRELIDDDEAPRGAELLVYPDVKAFLKKQGPNGEFSAKPAEKAVGPEKFATVLATVRALERLAELGLDVSVPAVSAAAEMVLATQAKDGGIAALTIGEKKTDRGKVVAVHFQGWALAALCRVGLDTDDRVARGFKFLLEWRQADGGWAWRGVRTDSPARPSSHLITGMALRAFAASPSRRTSREARRAAELLATRFLQPDRYPDRKAPSYWEQLAEPRFYVDMLDALDTVTAVGLGKENSGVRTAEAYVRGRQSLDGLWYPGPPPAPDAGRSASTAQGSTKEKDRDTARWLTVRALVLRVTEPTVVIHARIARCAPGQPAWKRPATKAFEESTQQTSRLGAKDAGDHVHAVIETAVVEQLIQRPHRPGLRIVATVVDPANAGVDHRARAHRAGLHRDVQISIGETPASKGRGGPSKSDDLSVRGGIVGGFALVVSDGDGLPADDNHSPDRNLSPPGRGFGRHQRLAHEGHLDIADAGRFGGTFIGERNGQ